MINFKTICLDEVVLYIRPQTFLLGGPKKVFFLIWVYDQNKSTLPSFSTSELFCKSHRVIRCHRTRGSDDENRLHHN